MSAEYLLANQPDILEVIANLSNDAVFTPPRVVNAVLDLLPVEVWGDPTLRWLDPGAKTGVFPREITKRLMVGLADTVPDEEARLQHILKEMVFAIATEEVTGLMARRSLYCSKDASSTHSVAYFDMPDGNVWQKRVEHSFNEKGTCTECKGTRGELELAGRDNKAYGFIHADGRTKIDKEMKMKFDVIVGNPPYQMSGGGGGVNDTAIYQLFVQQAVSLNPKYVSMIIPSRWMSSGRGLEGFREMMLTSGNIKKLVDYPDTEELFPGIQNEGGVCFFLWDREHGGTCEVTLVRGGEKLVSTNRILNEFDVFVRDARTLPILQKVSKDAENPVSAIASADTPFGLASNYGAWRSSKGEGYDLRFFHLSGGSRKWDYVSKDVVRKNTADTGKWKVFVPLAHGGKSVPDQVLGKPEVASPPSVCSQTFRYIGPFDSQMEAESFESYLRTIFFRFLVSLRKNSQNTYRDTYAWVPQQTWDRTWTDAELYKKYGITADEQAYIEAMVKEMPA